MTNPKTVSNRHGCAVITLPSDTEILITRVFDAPAELVFKAYTTPDLVRRWWGCETTEWLACEIDLREGGRWRYVTRDGGVEVGFHGEYREIAAPHRLVTTEMFEGAPDADDADAPLNIVTFEEDDGVTTMKVLVQCVSREQRAIILESGMESGMQIAYNRLEDLAREMADAG
ncbi:MAG: SRPBCC family protein [Longimicrobiales bacterium]